MKIQFIRHGLTAGNCERLYIGHTDEPLCLQGIEVLKQRNKEGYYEQPQILCASSLLRCQQTCAILFPGQEPILESNLREMNFGIFEGCSYAELQQNSDYQTWLDSGCTGPIPQGEEKVSFQQRCCVAFLQLLEQFKKAEQITLVVHGGVIMALLERFAELQQDFYEYHIENGAVCFYEWDGQWPVTLQYIER